MTDTNKISDKCDDDETVEALKLQLEMLRDANRMVMEELREKGRTIEILVEQRRELTFEVKTLRERLAGPAFTAPCDSQNRSPCNSKKSSPEKTTPSLKDMASKPRIHAQSLRPHTWELPPIEKSAAPIPPKSYLESSDETHEMPAVQSKKRKVASMEDQDDSKATQDKPSRSPHVIRSDSSTTLVKRLQPPVPTLTPRGHPWNRRKSVCTECWRESILCDFEGQCKPCRDAGIRCVRVECDRGSACDNPRCPGLHDGEWDKSDGDWIVVKGHLPQKRRDSYRPRPRA